MAVDTSKSELYDTTSEEGQVIMDEMLISLLYIITAVRIGDSLEYIMIPHKTTYVTFII